MENRIVNIGDTYGIDNYSFLIYQKNFFDSFEIIVVSKNSFIKKDLQRRLIFTNYFSKEQIAKVYNKSIILIEKKPWRIG